MEQRTCNIIMCCKGHCKLPGSNGNPITDVAAYMSNECACPMEDYQGRLLESIMEEALFDYMNSAKRPGADLRNLFNWTGKKEPTISERIASMFSLVQVMNDGGFVNGFHDSLINQSRVDLGEITEGKDEHDNL